MFVVTKLPNYSSKRYVIVLRGQPMYDSFLTKLELYCKVFK